MDEPLEPLLGALAADQSYSEGSLLTLQWFDSFWDIMSFNMISLNRLAKGIILGIAGLSYFNDTVSVKIYQTRFDGVAWDNDAWQITTTNLDQAHYQGRMSLANGYIGINVASLGPFFEYDQPVDGDNIYGWPIFDRRQTFASISGLWTDEKPSFLSGIPHWSAISLEVGDEVLNASTPASEISDFTSRLDMRQGLLDWTYRWSPGDQDLSFNITYQMFLHKLHINQALVQMNVQASTATPIKITNILDGDCAVRAQFFDKGVDDGLLYTAVQPNGATNITAYIYSHLEATAGGSPTPPLLINDSAVLGFNESSIGQTYSLSLEPRTDLTITKYIGIASSDGFGDPQAVARSAVISAARTGYDESLKSHTKEWEAIFTDDFVDDYTTATGELPNDPYLQELAIMSVVNPFLLLQNTVSQNALDLVANKTIGYNSISPGGLGSGSYGGMIFWDADLFMHLGLAATFPEAAKSITMYRARYLAQARENIAGKWTSTKAFKNFSNNSAVYPWVSGRQGDCSGQCFDYEYHISGDIVISLVSQFIADGDIDTFKNKYFDVVDSVASFYAELLTESNGTYDLTFMTDPDEYANFKNNGGFTMPLIARTLAWANHFRETLGLEPNSKWTEESELINIPIANGISLEYTGMPGDIAIKQADVVLKIFPLLWKVNYTNADALADFTYYSQKQILSGPAMTFAPFSVVANQIQNEGCAGYTYQNYGSNPYIRAPFFQMSEQMSDDFQSNGGYHPAFPFLTGHGADYHVALFGYLGLQYVPDGRLHVSPVLPPQIPQLRLRRFYWQGWPLKALANNTHTTITRLDDPLPNANQDYSKSPIPVVVTFTGVETTYSLYPSGTIVIPNREAHANLTISGNVLQCANIQSTTVGFQQGQFPMGAIDGYNVTKWQPLSASDPSSITVEVPTSHINKKLTSIAFNWQGSPPVQFTVTGTNSLLDNDQRLIIADRIFVNVSQPYDPELAAQVIIPPGNETVYKPVSDFQIPKYLTLTILGNQASDDPMQIGFEGATVAEWAVIAS